MKKILTAIITTVIVIVMSALCFTSLAATKPADVQGVRTGIRDNYVVIKWSESENATGYGVFRYDSSTKKWKSQAVVKNPSVTIQELTPGKNYIFGIRAYKKQNGKNVWSDSLTKVKLSTRPQNVTGLTASSKASSVTLTWDKAKGATGYRIFRYNPSTKKWDIALKATNKLTATLSSLNQGRSYIFAVRAYFNSGNGIVWSIDKTQIGTSTLPPAVSSITTSETVDSVTFSWRASSGATKYYIYKYDTAGKTYKAIASTTKTQYTVKNLEINKTYYFRLRAVRSVTIDGKARNFWSSYSDKIKIKTVADIYVWGEKYSDIINQHYPSGTVDNRYWVCDINNDTIPELFIMDGRSFAEAKFKIYTIRNGGVYLLGTVSGSHMTYVAPAKNNIGFYVSHVQMGYQNIYYYTMEQVEDTSSKDLKLVYSADLNKGCKMLKLTEAASCPNTDITALLWTGNPKHTNESKLQKGDGTFYGFK